jgi:hypothetical protein
MWRSVTFTKDGSVERWGPVQIGGIRGGSSKGLDNLRIAYERLESKRA